MLAADAPLGADFVSYANLRDEVFEIAVTPDRGYAVSVRGIARELASAFGVPFRDPAETATQELQDATLLGGELDHGALAEVSDLDTLGNLAALRDELGQAVASRS